jgi:hypothetical protein
MDRRIQILLGVIFALATALFFYTGLMQYDWRGRLPYFGMAAFSLSVALACLHAPSRYITLRLIGVTIFCLYAVYAYGDLGTPNSLRAILGFLVIGIPCGILAITGGYPKWGWLGGGFHPPKNQEPTEPPAATKNRR